MKKKQHREEGYNLLWKVLRIMRLSLYLIIISSAMAFSAASYSQSLTLKLNDVTIEEVIHTIESQSEFLFFYQEQQVDLSRRVTFQVTNRPIDEILNQLFAGTDNIFVINDRQIVIGKDPKTEKEKQIQIVKENLKPELDLPEQKKIDGKIKDKDGLPLPGVSVIVKGTTTGTVTNADGTFSLSIPADAQILQFSFVGMKMQEIPIEGKTTFSVIMQEETIGLDEVVAIGYGTQRRRDLTGSMSTISESKLENLQVTSVSEALAGMSPGVQVNQISGEPGAAPSIRVRGVGSITAGNEPLYVIDGFPTESNALSNFSILDIESITILKDASATSIYGSRGSNGVILISTKRGNVGPARISFEGYSGFSQITHKLDVLSPEEYVSFALDAVNRAWEYKGGSANDPLDIRPTFYQVPPYFLDPDSWAHTDWQDEIYQLAPVQNFQLSVDGGTETTRYKISGGYLDEDGIIKKSNFKRYTLGVNLDSDLTSKLRLSFGLNASKVNKREIENDGQWNSGIVCTALSLPGFYDVINEDGSYPAHAGMGYNTSAVNNPMVFLNEYHRKIDEYRIMGNISLEYDIIKGLYFKTYLGVDNQDIKNNFFRNTFYDDVPASTTFSRRTDNGAGSYSGMSRFDWLTENTLHYHLEWNSTHRIDALLGFTAQKVATENVAIEANNFPDNLVQTLNAGQVTSGSTTKTEWSMLSYLSRVNYAYDNKYFATATLRRDGSSRFGKGNRWGYFPSASLGWIVSEEDFFSDDFFMNYLKLKVSYGISGNNAIPDYGAIGLLSYSNYVVGGSTTPGQVPSTLSNDNLNWETSKQVNAGMEFGFFENRIQLNTEIYQSINDNLLLNVPVPSILGVTSALQNIGKVRNRGLELTLTTKNFAGEFNWTTDFNLSFNRNIVLELGPEGTPITSKSNQLSNITQIGRPIGDFYGYIFEGVYNTQDEIDNHPSLATDRPGDPIVKDVNGDGEITVDDKTVIGNYQPDFFYGLTNTFKYRNFDMSVLIQGVYGSDIMSLIFRQVMSMTGRTNAYGLARERWRSPEEPGNGKIFAASIDVRGVRRDPSTFYMQDGSFLRVRNISLGYTLTPTMVEKLGVSKARIYITSQNPFTFTNYIGYNPEVSTYHNALTPGIDYMNYPLAKSLTLGLNLTF